MNHQHADVAIIAAITVVNVAAEAIRNLFIKVTSFFYLSFNKSAEKLVQTTKHNFTEFGECEYLPKCS